jgi:hypothetical protein
MIVGNSGGGVWCDTESNAQILGCTIWGNSAPVGGGIRADRYAVPRIGNSILWGNMASDVPEISGLTSVTYTCVQGGFWGSGNIDADPPFLDPFGGDHHLQADSPCIDVGSNTDVPVGVTADIDGDARIIDGNGDGTDTVDMGADEYRADLAANPRPTPDPMRIESVTVSKVADVPRIRLCAKTASIPGQPGGAVEYRFEWTAGTDPGPNSAWQSSPVFDAAPVVVGVWYAYRVKARNAAKPSAETAWSAMEVVQAVGADFDLDGDVDLMDFGYFQGCFNGPNRPAVQSDCAEADIDGDADVDLADFALFHGCFNGPNRRPACP